MCSCITQHNATDVASFLVEQCSWHADCRMSTRAVAVELNVHFSTIIRLRRLFREVGSTSIRPHDRRPRVTTPAPTSTSSISHLQDRLRPATPDSCCNNRLHNQRISAQTVRNRLREAHLHACHPHRGLDLTAFRHRNRLEWGKCSHSMASGTLERCSLHGWILVFTVQGRWQTACMASCGWAVCWCQRCGLSGPWWRWDYGMVWAGVVMDNEHRCILLMAFWMHRDTVTRSWGPLLCHSSTTITSCCSMIMHGPMLQGSVHNSWKLKTSQFLHGQHTHRTCHPLSMFGMLWIGVYTTACSSSCQYPATSHSHWRGVDQHSTGHNQQPDQLYAKEMCCTVWGKWWSHQYWLVFGPPRTPPNTVKLHILEWPFIVASLRHTCAIIMLSNQHLDMPHLWGGWIISARRSAH